MIYYVDFSLYDYDFHDKPEGLTIGWLEDGYDYPVDEVSEEDLANITDLGSLRQHRSRGWHSCTLCGEYTEHRAAAQRAGITYRLGHAEIRAVSDDGVLCVAPNLIIHNIVDHLYEPPAEFIDAVRSEVRRRRPEEKCLTSAGHYDPSERPRNFMTRPYDHQHLEALGAQLHLPVTERTCPICGQVTMRIYHHTTYGRSEPSWINYLWCGNCHAYSSSFTGAGRKMVESDPLLEQYGDGISEVFRDPERLLKILDGYWKAGRLPQAISRRPRRG